jgi:hypothetical protein
VAAVRGSGPCGLCLSEGWRLGLVLIELLLNYWPVAGDYGLLSGKACISGGMGCCVSGLRTCGLDGLGLGRAVCSHGVFTGKAWIGCALASGDERWGVMSRRKCTAYAGGVCTLGVQ